MSLLVIEFINNNQYLDMKFSRFKYRNHTVSMGLGGLEPLTSRLSGVRSNRLSYRPIYGAGEGNRTLDNSLEGCGFTTKLHPHN